MNKAGEISYTFEDFLHRPITDEDTILQLISQVRRKPEHKGLIDQLNKETMAAVNADSASYTDIFKQTPHRISRDEATKALAELQLEHYEPLVFTEVPPNEERIRNRIEYEAKEKIKCFLWWRNKKKRKEYVDKNAPVEYESRLRGWEDRKRAFESEQAKIKQEKDNEYLNDYLESKRALDTFLTNDEEKVFQGLDHEGDKLYSVIPGDFGIDIIEDLSNGFVFAEVDLPEVTDLPTTKASILPSGKITFKQKNQKELQLDYLRSICGIAIFIAGRLFNVNEMINHVQVSGYTQRMNKATGELDDDFVYSVCFEREMFWGITFENIDPYAAMTSFPCRIKASTTGILSTIIPFPIPGEPDYSPEVQPQNKSKQKNNSRQKDIDGKEFPET